MSYSQDLCTVGRSGAFQGQLFGISTGRTVVDQNCERLKLSKYLYDMGMKVASVALLCQDIRVFKAMMMAGTPCPYNGAIGDSAKTAWVANVSDRPDAKEHKARLKREAKAKKVKDRTDRKSAWNTFLNTCKAERNESGVHKSRITCKKEYESVSS